MSFLDYGIAAAAGLLIGGGNWLLLKWLYRRQDRWLPEEMSDGEGVSEDEKPDAGNGGIMTGQQTNDGIRGRHIGNRILILAMPLIAAYLLWLMGGWSYRFGIELLLCGYLAPLALLDYRYKILPDSCHIVYGVIFLAYKLLFGSWYELVNGIIAMAGILLILGLISLAKKNQLGLGDVKLLGVCAFLVGMPGILYLFLRGLIVGAVYSAVQLFRHRADLRTELPLVPFLLAGALL